MNRKSLQADLASRAREVLRFDRFYSQRLREASEAARVNEVNVAELGIFLELLHGPCAPGWLSWRLDLDPGYVSRNLRQLELHRFITVCDSGGDRRMREVSLTDRGRMAARSLAQLQEGIVRERLEALSARQQRRLVRAMQVIIEILEQDALTNLLECRGNRPSRRGARPL